MAAPEIYNQFIATAQAEIPGQVQRPERCRAIIFKQSDDGAYVLGIGRHKPGREPYVVFPGGGLEPEDRTPRDGVLRELREELDIDENFLYLGDMVVRLGKEYFYAGYVVRDLGQLAIGGPESLRSAESGTYTPDFYPAGQLTAYNWQPPEIAALVDSASLVNID